MWLLEVIFLLYNTKVKKIIFIAILGLIIPVISFAHPGRTDSSGCHTCRTNCPNWGLSTREYHCHNAKALSQPKEPIKSTYGENGTGYTKPAPEYKTPKAVQKITPKAVEQKSIFTIKEQAPIVTPEPVKKKNFWARLFGF